MIDYSTLRVIIIVNSGELVATVMEHGYVVARFAVPMPPDQSDVRDELAALAARAFDAGMAYCRADLPPITITEVVAPPLIPDVYAGIFGGGS